MIRLGFRSLELMASVYNSASMASVLLPAWASMASVLLPAWATMYDGKIL